MKEKIISLLKRVFGPIFVSVLCGAFCGSVVYHIYDEKLEEEFKTSRVYLLQAGAYSSYDSMRVNTMSNNYVYYEDDGMYKAIIAIVKNKDNIDKIKELYQGEIIVTEYLLNDKEVDKQLTALDEELQKEEEQSKVRDIINDMLGIYKDNENIKLIKMS